MMKNTENEPTLPIGGVHPAKKKHPKGLRTGPVQRAPMVNQAQLAAQQNDGIGTLDPGAGEMQTPPPKKYLFVLNCP